MSLERVRTLLGKFGLTKPSDELAIQIIPLGPYIFFTDASGDNCLIVSEDYATQCLNSLSFRLGSLTRETFWSGKWLDTFMRYRSFDAFWGGLKPEPLSVSMAVPRTSETVGIGRAKRINRDWWLFEAETGEYSIVQNKDTEKWIIE